MIELISNAVIWAIIGSIPGFYAAYAKRYNPIHGLAAGAVIGLIIGMGGIEVGLITTVTGAAVTIVGVTAIATLLMPVGDFTETASRQTRINTFAYALIVPTMLIVLGIVVFPVLWNLIFSFRDIETEDLPTVDLIDFSEVSLENYDDRVGLTIQTTQCLTAFDPYYILYDSDFTPQDPTQGFIFVDTGARSETGLPTITDELVADQQYYAVMMGNTEALELDFTGTITGPGDISIDGATDEAANTYTGVTSSENVMNRPSRTGSRATEGEWWYHVQPFSVAEDGEYVLTAESNVVACRMDENGNIVYESLDDAGVEDYDNLISATIGDENIILGARDPDFYHVITRTLFYTLAGTILAILFGLICAIIVRDFFPGRAIFRGFVLFPYIAPVISVAFVWQVMLTESGPINTMLGTDIPFLNQGAGEVFGISVPLIMAILFQAWRYFPFAFLFLLARLQAIPDDLYEAAKVDGAAPSQRLMYITLPQLRSVFGTLFLLRFIWTFNKFDDIFLLVGNTSETRVITVEIYDSLFTVSNVGQASAIAIVMAVMLAIVLLIYFRFFLVEED